MSTVLDASAVLALVKCESGQEVVEAALVSGAVISTVSLTEVITRLLRDGAPEVTVRQTIERLPITSVDFDSDLALAAGWLSNLTRPYGLSLGDRACLALARRANAPAMTSDRMWERVGPLIGVTVVLIR
jgi:PIN domain nuclease of toxin-antitoxin system